MTANTMAEVLAEHIYKPSEAVCSCSDFVQVGLKCDPQTHPRHVAEVLSAAGFGLVADAKAEALEEAADDFEGNVGVGELVMGTPRTIHGLAPQPSPLPCAVTHEPLRPPT